MGSFEFRELFESPELLVEVMKKDFQRFLVEVMEKDFEKHTNSLLRVTRSILQSTKNGFPKSGPNLPDEATVPFWKEAYYSLVLLEKILSISNRLIALCFSAVSEACRADREKSLGAFFLMKPSRLFIHDSCFALLPARDPSVF